MTRDVSIYRDCKHGSLKRSCEICSLETEVSEQAAEIERKTQYGKEWMDKYLDLRKAAQMALDALEPYKSTALRWYTPVDAAIDALRKELT
ncbi:hypothetical protein UFOVP228_36 [uncultured Caudovirales phage]|uniref:Uncharacterized protein n=1 Tax=uncultured Caudovirales phage TaxID=2100421 RepID=A0A6J7WVD2_9CAUD|nr:hypothetical protein UFOVP47_66 [uncultured Caudovirales phage]CAB5219183.1 hypothetical protein UFOVP228_36 [uncultured Caudovirales phage]